VLLFTGALGVVLWPAIAALMVLVAAALDIPMKDLISLTGLT
jgi:hypothetical protein